MQASAPDRRLRFTIPPDQSGRTTLDFLHARFPCFPDSGWTDRIARQRLVLNGTATTPDRILQTADLLEYLDADIPEPAVNTNFSVIHRDAGLLVIDKPAGLPCHPGGRYFHNSLTEQLKLKLHLPDAPGSELRSTTGPILINRLDRETSGLVLVALDRRTAKLIQKQFAARLVEKRYTVFVEHAFPETLDTDGYILPEPTSVVRKRRRFIPTALATPEQIQHPDADHATTHFRGLRTNGIISEVEAIPKTGRTHQIRATLLACGFPVVGDKLYGIDPQIFLRFCNSTLTADDHHRLRLNRQALHAAYLRFRNPATNQFQEFQAPLPSDLQTLADWVRG